MCKRKQNLISINVRVLYHIRKVDRTYAQVIESYRRFEKNRELFSIFVTLAFSWILRNPYQYVYFNNLYLLLQRKPLQQWSHARAKPQCCYWEWRVRCSCSCTSPPSSATTCASGSRRRSTCPKPPRRANYLEAPSI